VPVLFITSVMPNAMVNSGAACGEGDTKKKRVSAPSGNIKFFAFSIIASEVSSAPLLLKWARPRSPPLVPEVLKVIYISSFEYMNISPDLNAAAGAGGICK